MNIKLALIVFYALGCFPSFSQTNIDFSLFSPKLRDFLASYPDCRILFAKTIREAAYTRQFTVLYFYTTNESVPRASHYYSDEVHVTLLIRENQQAFDEFFSIMFETMNSENETNFNEILHLAAVGKISRTDFPLRMMKLEFSAVIRMRDLISGLKLPEKETLGSHYYEAELGCPTNFDEYLAYIKKKGPSRDQIKEYQMQYDWLRQQGASSSEGTAPH